MLLFLFSFFAFAEPQISCPMQEVLRNINNPEALKDYRLLQIQQENPVLLPPPSSDKPIYSHGGEWWWDGESRVTDNFYIAYYEDQSSSQVVDMTAEALEKAWQVLIEEKGWAMPISTDQYLLWVVLDLNLDHTGYTFPFWSNEFGGYVTAIYLNPYYAYDELFYRALVHHEFMHTIQFEMRVSDDYSDEESWYWEASAQWAPELVDPELNGYIFSVENYANYPWYTYSSMENEHQYGMCILNAYIEENHTGSGGMKEIWEQGRFWGDSYWDSIILESTGLSLSELWGGFVVAFGNEQLQDSFDYPSVWLSGILRADTAGSVLYLGTDYYQVDTDATLIIDGNVLASSPHGTGEKIQVRVGDIVGITGMQTDGESSYQVNLSEAKIESEIEEENLEQNQEEENEKRGACQHLSASNCSFFLSLLLIARFQKM